MKIFVCVALATIVAIQAATLTAEQKEKLVKHHKECSASSGVSDEVVEKVRKGEFPAVDDKLKEHLFCVSKKIGFLDDAGEINKDILKTKLSSILDAAVVDKMIEQCAVKKDNGPQTAYDSIKCFHENTSDHIVIV